MKHRLPQAQPIYVHPGLHMMTTGSYASEADRG